MEQYFTLESLLAYEGAVIAVSLVTAVVVYLVPAVQPHAKWLAAGLALFLSYLLAFVSGAPWTGYIVAFFNGALIFASSVGINAMTGRAGQAVTLKPVPGERGVWYGEQPRPRFWQRW